MSIKKDNKTLQKLYESISEFSFLEEEEMLFKDLSERIVKHLYNNKKNFNHPQQSNHIEEFVPHYLFNDSIQSLNLEKDIDNPFFMFFSSFCFEPLIKQHCYLKIEANQEIIIQFRNYQYSYEYINLKDFEKVKEKIIEYLKMIALFFIEKFEAIRQKQTLGNYTTMFLDWREDKLKFHKLRKKLPEFEGIF
jgi:hypothetical protein